MPDKECQAEWDAAPVHAPVPHSGPPAWVTDLSPYPAPEDYAPVERVELTDVPWSAPAPREA